MLAVVLVSALVGFSCGGESDTCPVAAGSVTSGGVVTSCDLTFADSVGNGCYDGNTYEVDCTREGDVYACSCFENGTAKGTCTNTSICNGANGDTDQTRPFAEECCGWNLSDGPDEGLVD